MPGPKFSLGTFESRGQDVFPAIVLDNRIFPLSETSLGIRDSSTKNREASSIRDVIEEWEINLPALQDLAKVCIERPEHGLPLTSVRFLPPLQPRQIFCAGANYRQHVIDLMAAQASPDTKHLSFEVRRELATKVMDERVASGEPYAFIKLPSAITGPFDPIVLPRDVGQPDWELELGVVIGKHTWRVPRERALESVAGYLVTNDISARDRIFREDMKVLGTDWLSGKNSPTFLPIGPTLTPSIFVPDPMKLQVTLKLNGKVMQDESTADMIFDIARLIEYMSARVRLLPGDIICTGSPAGNGAHYGRYLTDGDVLEGTISGLGTIRNTCRKEA